MSGVERRQSHFNIVGLGQVSFARPRQAVRDLAEIGRFIVFSIERPIQRLDFVEEFLVTVVRSELP